MPSINEKQTLLPNILRKPVRVYRQNVNNKIQLSSISSKNLTIRTLTSTEKKIISERSGAPDTNNSGVNNCELKLLPIPSKNPPGATSILEQVRTLNRRSNQLNRSSSYIANTNKLLPILVADSVRGKAMHKGKELLPATSKLFTDTDNCIMKSKSELLQIPSRNEKKKVSFVESNTPCSIPTLTILNEIEEAHIITKTVDESFSNCNTPEKHTQVPFYPHSTLVWLLSNTIKSTLDFENSIRQLQQAIDTINWFTNFEQCIDFVQKNTDDTIYLIVSNDLGQSTVPHIHDMSQLNYIYMLGKSNRKHK